MEQKHIIIKILQATLVHPDMKLVIPLALTFIRNGNDKQDCEISAGKRLINKIKKEHPYLPNMKQPHFPGCLYPVNPMIRLVSALYDT